MPIEILRVRAAYGDAANFYVEADEWLAANQQAYTALESRLEAMEAQKEPKNNDKVKQKEMRVRRKNRMKAMADKLIEMETNLKPIEQEPKEQREGQGEKQSEAKGKEKSKEKEKPKKVPVIWDREDNKRRPHS